jgi:hypothetical protein
MEWLGHNEEHDMDEIDEDPPQPSVTGAPNEIWLVYGDLEESTTHAEEERHGEVHWCGDKQFSSDVRYVLADEFDKLREALVEISELKSLTATPTQFYQHLQRIARRTLTANAMAEGLGPNG